jgi:hypothetical protein
MKAGLYKLSSNKISEKKNSSLRLFFLLLWLLSVYSIQNNLIAQGNFGRFLNSNHLDYLGYLDCRNIYRVDLDANGSDEIVALVSDSLIICYSDSTQYIKAFNPNFTFDLGGWGMQYWDQGSSNGYIFAYGITGTNQLPWTIFNPLTGDRYSSEFGIGEVNEKTIHPDGTIWFNNEEFFPIEIYKTTNFDLGSTLVTNVGIGDTLFNFGGGHIYGPSIFISKDGQYISTVVLSDNIFTSGNPGGIYHYYSLDAGTTWQGEIIARGSRNNPEFGQIINRNIAPYFSPSSLFSGVMDDNGILHLALYGYGCSVNGSDTTEYTPILYWNSRDKNWIAVTDPELEKMTDYNGNSVSQFAPGFALGQSLPTISVSRDGEVILFGWVSPEYTGTPGNLILNIYPGDGGTFSQPIYYTNLLTNISFNSGVTWSIQNINPLKSNINASEMNIKFTEYLTAYSNGSVVADYIYFVDSVPGYSGHLQNGVGKMNPFYYDTFIYGEVPIELISFTAEVVNNKTNLKWSTASELNNIRFEVERKQIFSQQSSVSNSEWKSIGFVEGKGTTTETQFYSFVDEYLFSGKYQYRLKQIDFDGTFTYSNIVEVDVSVPNKFSLEQNYPNPFNPSTVIKYSIAEESSVNLLIYNSIGQKITELVNKNQAAGNYEIKFDGNNLSSGVYFYSLEANSTRGNNNFKKIKKMILVK